METSALTHSASARDAAPPPAAPPVAPPDLRVARPRWLVTYTAVLVVLDGTAMAAATLAAKISWLGIDPEPLLVRSFSIPYTALTLVTVPTWLVLLALAGAYDLGPFASDSEGWTRVIRAGAQLLAVIAVSYYIVHLALLGRGVLAGTVPLAVILTLGERTLAQLGLGELRRRGHARRTALVIGSHDGVDAFVGRVASRPTAEVTVVGVSVIGTGDPVPALDDPRQRGGTGASARRPRHDGNGSGRNGSNGNGPGTYDAGANGPGVDERDANGSPVNGSGVNGSGVNGSGVDEADLAIAGAAGAAPVGAQAHPLVVSDALARTRAETLIVTGGLAQGQLRDIAWMLQGTGVELLVIPTPADIEGLRTEIRPVAGLPLLYLDR